MSSIHYPVPDLDKLHPNNAWNLGVPIINGVLQVECIDWDEKARVYVVVEPSEITAIREDGEPMTMEQVIYNRTTLQEIARRPLLAAPIAALVLTKDRVGGDWQINALNNNSLEVEQPRVKNPEGFQTFIETLAEGAVAKQQEAAGPTSRINS